MVHCIELWGSLVHGFYCCLNAAGSTLDLRTEFENFVKTPPLHTIRLHAVFYAYFLNEETSQFAAFEFLI